MWFFAKPLVRRLATVLAVAAGVGLLLVSAVTSQFGTPRPSVEPETVGQALPPSSEQGDPSGEEELQDDQLPPGPPAQDSMAEQVGEIARLQAMGQHQLAAEAIERFLRDSPKERQSVQGFAGLCEYLLKHGDIANARRILDSELMVRWPDAVETTYLRGKVALESATGEEEIAAAAQLLKKCVAQYPNHVPASLQLGIAYRRLGQWDQAESLLRQVLESRPHEPVVLFQLAELLQQQGKDHEAATFLDKHKRLSELQQRQKQLQSKGFLNQAQPADFLELAQIQEELGELARAASSLRAYTRRQPNDAAAHRELARLCLKIDDHEGAREATELADRLESERRP